MQIKFLDNWLNQITMYRLVIYSLGALSIVTIIMGALGQIYYDPISLVLGLFVLFMISWFGNSFLAKMFGAQTNAESTAITALILFFVMAPADDLKGFIGLGLTALITIASKYVLALNKRHLFNPAAVGAFIAPFLGVGFALWWIGSSVLLPFTLIVGLLVVRKIRRFQLFFSVILSSSIAVVLLGLSRGVGAGEILSQHFLSWPIVFFASIMATEPLTTPPTRKWQVIYGLAVGAMSSIPFSVGSIHNTPELTLLLGNILSYSVSLKRRLILKFESKTEIAHQTYELKFKQDEQLKFKAGQYLEWTLPHEKSDNRGMRRYFTIASSPTEKQLILGVKSADKPSSFKSTLFNLEEGKEIVAGQLNGDFVLPDDQVKKLVFIAGGIGITPFRSMTQYLLDTNQKRDIVLFYANKTEADIAYKDIFTKAENQAGLKAVYLISEPSETWKGETGFLNPEMLKKYASDFSERTYYISGPAGMVDAYKKMLIQAGISRTQIITDYFPGLA